MKKIKILFACGAVALLLSSFTLSETIEVSNNKDFAKKCCQRTGTSGEPGTDGYTSVTVVSCFDSNFSDSFNMDQACNNAQSRANRVASIVAAGI